MNKYFRLMLFSTAVAMVYLMLSNADFAVSVHSTGLAAILFFTSQSLLLLWGEGKFVKDNSQNFVLFVIGSISFRLFTSLLVAIGYLVAVGEENASFILTFFALYLLFLGFELFTLMTNLRSNSKRDHIDD